MIKEIVFSTATALADAIRQKQVSAEEVLDAHLAHIAKHNPALNALVVVYEEAARKQARDADEAFARGEAWGPLHGVPVTFKNAHSVAGQLSPWGGHPDYAQRVPTEDSSIPAKLRQAGAVILGMTNVRLLDNNIFGSTKNPWGPERTTDGTSAGSAAAVAAGLSPLDIGADSLGSILGPASFCGVFGMRPTEHRVSLAGSKVMGTPHTWQPFTVFGPLTRSIEDAELALRAISGPDGRDMNVPPIPWRDATGVTLRGLRIAWSDSFPNMPLALDIRHALEDLVDKLRRLGAHLEQTMPELDYVAEHKLAWQFMSLTWEDVFRKIGWIPPDAPPLRLDDFYKAVHQREEFTRIWELFFTQWDVFLSPYSMTTAALLTDTSPVVDGKSYTTDEAIPVVNCISPLTGLPAIVVPVGLDSHGLPICLQLIGKRWGDEHLLAIAKLISAASGGFRKPPGY